MSIADKNGTDSPVKQALVELRRLKARLEKAESANRMPIAIIGMGLRLPGGIHTPEAFWEKLDQGFDGVGTIPASRWSMEEFYDPDPDAPGKTYSRHGAFLDDVDGFDADFFGISPREANTMDPQQRLLLEVAWEALEHAGIAPKSLWGSSTGVYLGISTDDYSKKLFAAREMIDPYFATGSAHSVAAGRLSYFLSLKGPSRAVDTACSASLVAVHLACQSLRNGESTLALTGGVNLILSPDLHINFSKSRMLSTSGRCRTFDRDADGYVRGEGCGVLVLKPLDRAMADRDTVLAVIRGSAVNQDGRSGGLTAPNGPSQEAVINAALQNSGIAPLSVNYVEAHGTGTSLGDPIEIGALGRVYCQGRSPGAPLWVGSVKTNFGHLEAAAGITGLIKTTIMLQKGMIPPSLHFENPSPHIPWSDYSLKVPTQSTPLPTQGERIAGVSSFGFSGTNAHLILAAPPQLPIRTDAAMDTPGLLCLSARSETALSAMAQQWRRRLADASPTEWEGICTIAAMGRSHFDYRLAVLSDTPESAVEALDTYIRGGDSPDLLNGTGPAGDTAPKIAFLYPGQVNGYPGMGRDLYESQPVFRKAVDHCDQILAPMLKQSLVEHIYGPGSPFSPDDRPEIARAAVFMIEYAVTMMLRAWGVEPDIVMGSGLGKYTAAWAAGIMDLESALRLLLATPRDPGTSDPSPPTDINRQHFELVWNTVRLRAPEIDMISPLTGAIATSEQLNLAAYWLRHADVPERFAEGVHTLINGHQVRVLMEVGPDAVLTHPDGTGHSGENVCWLRVMRRSDAVRARLLRCLGTLYTRGVDIRWQEVFDTARGAAPSAMPTYPFQRKRYWFESEPLMPAVSIDPSWEKSVEAARHQSTFIPMDLAPSRYPEKWRALDTLTDAYIENCFRDLGLFSRAGETHTTETLLKTARINPHYTHMIQRWLMHLTDNGTLQRSPQGDSYTAEKPLSGNPIDRMIAQTELLFSDIPFLLNYVKLCGEKLPHVITGRESALETLFPGGSYAIAENLYRDWAVARYFNAVIGAVLSAAVSNGPVRILEIGAGTGGTTDALLKLVPRHSQYLFTDLSDFFLEKARNRFQAYPNLRTAILNIEKSPAEQNIPENAFNIVVAANVLHATKNLDRTMTHVRRLMTPGGILLLYETTRHPKWFDITTGLIEGWQLFNDGYRTSVPLIDAGRWRQVLNKNGFEDVQVFPENSAYDEIFFQHAIIARSSSDGVRLPTGVMSMLEIDEVSTDDEKDTTGHDAFLEQDGLVQRLKSMTVDEQVEQCRDYVSRHLASVFHKKTDTVFNIRHNLIDLGVDSLMALELRNRLARGLSLNSGHITATLIFDYPNIAAIVDYLLEIMDLSEDLIAPDVVGPDVTAEAETSLAGGIPFFDEDADVGDIKRLLAEKLDLLGETDQLKSTE